MEEANIEDGVVDASPLDDQFEFYADAPHGPDDVIYAGSDHEAYENANRRRQKLEEAAAQFYKTKTTPRLTSAALTGPFETGSGWLNPWAKTPRFDQEALHETLALQPDAVTADEAQGEDEDEDERLLQDVGIDSFLATQGSVRSGQNECMDVSTFERVRKWAENVEIDPLSKEEFWMGDTGTADDSSGTKRKMEPDWLKTSASKRMKSGTQSSSLCSSAITFDQRTTGKMMPAKTTSGDLIIALEQERKSVAAASLYAPSIAERTRSAVWARSIHASASVGGQSSVDELGRASGALSEVEAPSTTRKARRTRTAKASLRKSAAKNPRNASHQSTQRGTSSTAGAVKVQKQSNASSGQITSNSRSRRLLKSLQKPKAPRSIITEAETDVLQTQHDESFAYRKARTGQHGVWDVPASDSEQVEAPLEGSTLLSTTQALRTETFACSPSSSRPPPLPNDASSIVSPLPTALRPSRIVILRVPTDRLSLPKITLASTFRPSSTESKLSRIVTLRVPPDRLSQPKIALASKAPAFSGLAEEQTETAARQTTSLSSPSPEKTERLEKEGESPEVPGSMSLASKAILALQRMSHVEQDATKERMAIRAMLEAPDECHFGATALVLEELVTRPYDCPVGGPTSALTEKLLNQHGAATPSIPEEAEGEPTRSAAQIEVDHKMKEPAQSCGREETLSTQPKEAFAGMRLMSNTDVMKLDSIANQASHAALVQSPWQKEVSFQQIEAPDVRDDVQGLSPVSMPGQLKHAMSSNSPDDQGSAGDEQDENTPPFHRVPSTPERQQSSLPTPDFTLSIKSFRLFHSPPSEQSRPRTGRDCPTIGERLPSTQQLNDSLTANPWKVSSGKKSSKRVSFGPLPGEGACEEYTSSRVKPHGNVSCSIMSRPRAGSPPPKLLLSDLPPETEKFKKHFAAATAHRRSSSQTKPVRPQVSHRLLPSSSQQRCPSPPVGAMAEAFIQADAQLNDGGTAVNTGQLRPQLSVLKHKPYIEPDEPPDEVSAVLDNLGDFLGTSFDVTDETENPKPRVTGIGKAVKKAGPTSRSLLFDIGVWD